MPGWFDSAVLSTAASRTLPILLDAAVKSLIVLVSAVVATAVMRRSSAAARHFVWFLAVAGLLILPVLSVTLPGWQILPRWIDLSADAAPDVAAFQPLESESPAPVTLRWSDEPAGPGDSFESITAPPAAIGEVQATPAEPTADGQEAAGIAPVPDKVGPDDGPRRGQAYLLVAWVPLVWMTGTLLVLGWLCLGAAIMRRLGRRCEPIVDGSWTALLGRLSAELKLDRSVRLLRSDHRSMPMAWGIFRPRLLLPAEAADWPADRRRVVLLHELAHIKRRDPLTQFITQIACALYWFNPLVWVAARRMVTERERACDDLVLAAGSAACDYADHVLQIASSLRTSRLVGAAAIAMARPSSLEGRLLSILDNKRSRRALTRTAAVLLVVAFAAIILPIGMMRAMGAAKELKEETPAAADSGADADNAAPRPFSSKLANGVSVELLGLVRLVDDKPIWWAPDGRVIEGPSIPVADLKNRGIVLACRVTPPEVTFKGCALRRSTVVEFKRSWRVEGTDLWLAELDLPEDRRFIDLSFRIAGGEWKILYTLPLTAKDAGREKLINNYKVREVLNLRKVNAETISLSVLHERYLPGQRFAAVDKAGRIYAPTQSVLAESLSLLTFALPLEQIAGIVRQEQRRCEMRVRNVSLRPGQKAAGEVEAPESKQTKDEPGSAAAEAQKKPLSSRFGVTLPGGGGTIDVLGVMDASADLERWWAPDGGPGANPGALPADIEDAGTIVAIRVDGRAARGWMPFRFKDARREQILDLWSVSAGHFWVVPLTVPKDATAVSLVLDVAGGSYDLSAKIPLTAADVGFTRRQIGQIDVAEIYSLRRTQPGAFEVKYRCSRDSSVTDLAAIDKTGQMHSGAGSSGDTFQTVVFSFPVEDLVSLIPWRDDGRREIHIRDIAVRPGVKTDMRIEVSQLPREKALGPQPFREITLPELDSSKANIILELASGRLLPAAQEDRGQLAKLGKGDLAYDGSLLCLRGATMSVWKDGKLAAIEPVAAQEKLAKYEIPEISNQVYVKTAEGEFYEILLRPRNPGGLILDYRRVNQPTGPGIAGVARLPDGAPAAGAEVLMCASGSPTAHIRDGVLDRTDCGMVVSTGADGRYSFPPQPGPYALVAMHDRGWCLAPVEDIPVSGEITLQPWGQVRGTARIGSRPAKGEEIRLTMHCMPRPYDERQIWAEYHATTDERGGFTFRRVPPGDGFIGKAFISGRDSSGQVVVNHSPSFSIHIEPGQTVPVMLGGSGRPLIGRVVLPPGAPPVDWSHGTHFMVSKQDVPYPPGLTNNERSEWHKKWRTTPEGRSQPLTRRSDVFKLKPDGSFRIEDVPAGGYTLEVDAYLPPREEQDALWGRQLVGTFKLELEVPDIPGGRSDEPLDLGVLVLGTSGVGAAPGGAKPDKPALDEGLVETRPAPGRDLSMRLADAVEFEMVWVPGGTFEMGNSSSEQGRDNREEPVHTVKLEGFWIGKYEVTQEQYELVMGVNPSHFRGAKNPVEMVSWHDATAFCEKLSERFAGRHFTLPSEAQWEYACRAGSRGRFCFGESDSDLGKYAWYGENSGGTTHAVGGKRANGFGLYDMHGNVWEICRDDRHEDYNGAPSDGSSWGDGSSTSRMGRGGSWNDSPSECRSAIRSHGSVKNRDGRAGFRIVATFQRGMPHKSSTTRPTTRPEGTASGPQVAGLVVNEVGEPVGGAVVGFMGGWATGKTVTTAKDGTFALVSEDASLLLRHVLAVADGGERQGIHGFGWNVLDVTTRTPIKIVLKPSRRVSVRVVDGSGRPVSDARVGLTGDFVEAAVHTGKTDADGAFLLRVPADLNVDCAYGFKAGVGFDYFENYPFWPPRESKRQLPPEQIKLVLDGAQQVRIRAVDSKGQPLSKVSFRPFTLTKSGKLASVNLWGSQVAVQLSNENGVASFDWLPANLVKPVSFECIDYGQLHTPDRPVFWQGSSETELTARLLRNARVAGKVSLPDGTPARDILIQAEGRGATRNSCSECIRTAADGSYSAALCPDQSYILAVIDDTWAAPSHTGVILREDQTRSGLDFRLAKGTLIRGTVTSESDGSPVAGKTVNLRQIGPELPEGFRTGSSPREGGLVRWVRSDAAGHYALRVGPGTYEVFGPDYAKQERLNVATEAEIVRNLEFDKPDLKPLAGLVVNETNDEKPVSGAIIFAEPTNEGKPYRRCDFRATTDGQGRFKVLREVGPMVLYARDAEGLLAGWVRVSDSQDEVTVPLASAARATGRVVDKTGKPLAGQKVVCQLVIGIGGAQGSIPDLTQLDSDGNTDANGAFTIPGLPDEAICRIYLLDTARSSFEKVYGFYVRGSGSIAIPDLVIGVDGPVPTTRPAGMSRAARWPSATSQPTTRPAGNAN